MKKHDKYALLMVILISLVFGAFLIFVNVSSRLDEVSNVVIDDVNLSMIDDGIYNGESDVSPVYIDINVEVVNHEIINIEINYKNVFIKDQDLELVINLIYDNQSLEFDYSDYDLYTSIALLNAVSNALS